MAPRGEQYPHCNFQKGRPDGQCRKIQDHELPYGGDLYRYFIGGVQSEDHRIGDHLPGGSPAAHTMPGLRGGVDGRVHAGPSKTIAWDGASD